MDIRNCQPGEIVWTVHASLRSSTDHKPAINVYRFEVVSPGHKLVRMLYRTGSLSPECQVLDERCYHSEREALLAGVDAMETLMAEAVVVTADASALADTL